MSGATRKTLPERLADLARRRTSPALAYPPPALAYPPPAAISAEAALRRAWLAVQANGGAGGDGETLAQFSARLDENLDRLGSELRQGTYRPQPVKQILVPKPSGGWRPITLWTVRDRVAQRAVYDYLLPVWDAHFLACSYGFRPGRTTQTAAEAVSAALADGCTWAFEGDIRDCFGSMQNARVLALAQRWQVPPAVGQLIAAWLEARIFNAWRGRDVLAGTSQGGVLSPLLCNLYLHSLDAALQRDGWWPVRYADDFVVLAQSQRLAEASRRHTEHTLRQLGLELHPEKSHITAVADGFRFVGWFFVRGERYKLR